MPAPFSPPRPRRSARIADILCLLLIGLAIIVAVTGGFRLRLGGLRLVSLTSPGPLLIWAVAVAVLRHVLAPQAPIYRDLPVRLGGAWRTPDVRVAMTALASTRAAVLFVGYMAVFTIGFPDPPPFRVSPNEFANLQARWDSGWYLGIASGGYSYGVARAERQRNIVFFPAFPMLMRVAGRMLGGSSTAFLVGGTVVSLFAFVGALIYLYRLARSTLGDDDQARYAVWLLAAYPFALFYSAVYSESLFLVGALGAFYHFRRREFARAGAWALLVGLTRPNGFFLSIPLAILVVKPWLPAWLAGGADEPNSERAAAPVPIVPALLAAAMPCVGVLLYSAFIWRLTGSPLSWAAGHVAWGRSYQGLPILVTERYEYLAREGLYAYTSKLSMDLLQAIGPIFVLATVWGVARRLGLAYAVFILINILLPLAAGGLLSAGRISSALFPAFIWFATVVPAHHRPAWLASFMAVQALNAALFYTWRPMY